MTECSTEDIQLYLPFAHIHFAIFMPFDVVIVVVRGHRASDARLSEGRP